ncbi:MAG: hypothetical protein WBM17_12665 [Anaerolineales bacterium]
MAINSSENNLANFKRVLLIWVGAAVTLLAVAIADIPNNRSPFFPGWYGVWVVLQVGAITPAVLLLFGSGFRKLPFPERLNTLFAYLAVSWIVLVAFVIKSGRFFTRNITTYFGFANGIGITFTMTQLYAMTGIIGAGIGIAYWILQHKFMSSPEAMFP